MTVIEMQFLKVENISAQKGGTVRPSFLTLEYKSVWRAVELVGVSHACYLLASNSAL
jgi:hypothetical protein